MSNEPTAAEIARAKRKAKLLAREKQLNAGQHFVTNEPVPEACDKAGSPVKKPDQPSTEDVLKELQLKKQIADEKLARQN